INRGEMRMYVCLCKGVNDKTIHKAVACGDVESMRDLRQQYGVASQCGCCKQCAKETLQEALSARDNSQNSNSNNPAKIPASVCYT
ncbi:MAG: (2Fe-2S)-binding protein, partial [Pseudomonadota bacterium]